MKAPQSSTIKYIFKVSASEKDSQPQNNIAQAVALIKGIKPVLIISENSNSTMRDFFVNNKVLVNEKKPKDFHWTIEDLSGFSTVILEDVSADQIGYNGMHSFSAWVKHMGGGS